MIVELNTMDNPTPGMRDESLRVLCVRCGNRFSLGRGMDYDETVAEITAKHFKHCEGVTAVALMKIEQDWKAGWRPKGAE